MIEQLKNKKVGFISLGCDKNRVDLERIIFNLSNCIYYCQINFNRKKKSLTTCVRDFAFSIL